MKIRAGDREAIGDLLDRHRDGLRRVVALRFDPRLRTRLDASDVVQETEAEALRRMEDFVERRPMPFALWLRKTAQQRLMDHRRKHLQAARRSVYRERPLPDHSSMMIAAPFLARSSLPGRRLARREYERLVGEAVSQLSELEREILLMRNVEGLSHVEIAQVLDLSHDVVRKRYGRALIKLRQLLVDKAFPTRSLT